MDCSLSGFSVHGIFQAKVLEWIAISFSRESSRSRNWIQVSHIAGRCFTVWATREAIYAKWVEGLQEREGSLKNHRIICICRLTIRCRPNESYLELFEFEMSQIKRCLNQNKFIGSCNWKVRDWGHCQTLDAVIQYLSLLLSVHHFSIWANPSISFHRLNSSRHQVQGKLWRSDSAAISGLNRPQIATPEVRVSFPTMRLGNPRDSFCWQVWVIFPSVGQSVVRKPDTIFSPVSLSEYSFKKLLKYSWFTMLC